MRPGTVIPLGPDNARVTFLVRWFGLLRVDGWFSSLEGRLHVADGVNGIEVTADVSARSVQTGIGLRDRHLRGPRFLHADRNPRILFRGTGTWRDGLTPVLAGHLTLRGSDRWIEARCVVVPETRAEKPGTEVVIADFTIPRRDHGIAVATGLSRFNPLLWAIGESVGVRVEVHVPVAVLRPEPALARGR
ncbi:MAG TPA: YceI family protein [Gemmatimonadaceae bacterium]